MLGALLLVFGMWWTYFRRDVAGLFARSDTVFVVGLGHLPVFAAIAATGGALAAAVDVVQHEATASTRAVGLAIAVPVAVYALVLAGLHAIDAGGWRSFAPALVFASATVVTPLLGVSMGTTVLVLGLLMATSVVHYLVAEGRRSAGTQARTPSGPPGTSSRR